MTCVTAWHKSSRLLLILMYQFLSVLKYRVKSTCSWSGCINDNISEVFYKGKCAPTVFYVCFKGAVNCLLSVWPDLYINMHFTIMGGARESVDGYYSFTATCHVTQRARKQQVRHGWEVSYTAPHGLHSLEFNVQFYLFTFNERKK